jgi:hypothetical protein
MVTVRPASGSCPGTALPCIRASAAAKIASGSGSRFAEAHPRSVGERRRTQSTQQRKDPGDITGPAAVGR